MDKTDASIRKLEDNTAAIAKNLDGSLINVPAIYEEAKCSVVQILIDIPERGLFDEGWATGYLSGDKREDVVSAWHVVEGLDIDTLSARFCDGEVIRFSIAGSKILEDLVVLRLKKPRPDLKSLELADEVAIGEEVVGIGHPFDLDYTAVVGRIAALDRDGAKYPQAVPCKTCTGISL